MIKTTTTRDHLGITYTVEHHTRELWRERVLFNRSRKGDFVVAAREQERIAHEATIVVMEHER